MFSKRKFHSDELIGTREEEEEEKKHVSLFLARPYGLQFLALLRICIQSHGNDFHMGIGDRTSRCLSRGSGRDTCLLRGSGDL